MPRWIEKEQVDGWNALFHLSLFPFPFPFPFPFSFSFPLPFLLNDKQLSSRLSPVAAKSLQLLHTLRYLTLPAYP